MCLFLEDWAAARDFSPEQYEDWKDKTLAYYSRLAVSTQPKPKKDDNAVTRKIVSSIELRGL